MEIFKQDHLSLQSAHGNKRPFIYDIRYEANGKPKPILLFVHGFKGFKDWGVFNQFADDLAQAGLVVVKCNLSHNGTTPERPLEFADLEAFGHNNLSIELDDLERVISSILDPTQAWKSEIDSQRLGLIGHSRGGSLVLLKAAEDPRVKAVASLAAVADLSSRYAQDVLHHWEQQGVLYIDNSRTGQRMPLYYQLAEDFKNNPERLSVERAVKNLDIPLLLVHGSADTSVAVQDMHKLHSWQPQAELVEIAGADHTFGGSHPWEQDNLPKDFYKVSQELIKFFRAKL